MNKLLLFFLLFVITLTTKAAESEDIWKSSAAAVCAQITKALEFYQKGNVKNAQTQAIMAYFKGYDAEIEPAVRITLGGSHVFEVEHQFRDFKKAMIANPDQKQLEYISQLSKQLCETMYADAEALNKAKVKKEVFKVD
ncbi:MAG TPA: hypothetical protein VHM20_05375 [Gammaproteobacteria bacterium]|jgi:predicted negative regulator of RcsB-dependent stress response|nr:hypothetical protein [Gammaproteobacteria bacterium]